MLLVYRKATGFCIFALYHANQSLVNKFPLRTGFIKKKHSAPGYFKMVPSWFTCWKPKGLFSDIYCRNLVKLLEINLTILLQGFPMTRAPLFLFVVLCFVLFFSFNSQSSVHWASSNFNYRLDVPTPGLVPTGISAHGSLLW